MNVENIREFCLSLPAVEEDLKWGDNLVFTIKTKMFCIISLDSHPLNMSFKVDDEEFEILSDKFNYKPAPYLAKAKWIQIKDASLIGDKLLREHLKQAYTIIRSKLPIKQQQEIIDNKSNSL